MDNARLLRILLILLILLASSFLAQMLWQLISGYADVILLFVLGWLLAFVLNPLVSQLSRHPVPAVLRPLIASALGEPRAQAAMQARMPRAVAVVIVYIILLLAIVIILALFMPAAITQLSQLANRMPDYVAQTPAATQWAQSQLTRLGIHLNVNDAISAGFASLQGYATTAIENTLAILTSLFGFFANLFFVLILGFIMTLDGPRLRKVVLLRLIPQRYRAESHFFLESVDRTFGGFIRGQLTQALLMAVGVAAGMAIARLNYVLIASSFSALLMWIPLLGPFLALIPPVFACLVQTPGAAVWLTLGLLAYQMVLVNALMPRLMSDALGLHPLFVFAALLIGVRAAGFWGAFFGIPVAGVLWAMAMFFFERWQGDHPLNPDLEKEQAD